MKQWIQIPLFFGSLLMCFATLLCFKNSSFLPEESRSLLSQNMNNYLGPDDKDVKKGSLVRVQVAVYDDPDPKGVQIQKAQFDQNNIPLKPRDINGFRGQASFQNRPGTYLLKWSVQKDKTIWPRTETFQEEVTLDPRDLWIQITIRGSNASIQ